MANVISVEMLSPYRGYADPKKQVLDKGHAQAPAD